MATVGQAEQLITGEQFARMNLENCELVEGRIVPVSPAGFDHGELELRLGARLFNFVEEHRLGRVSGGEAGVYTKKGPDTIRGADVLFISHQRYAERDLSKTFLDVAPELVVEVRSPGDSKGELQQKLHEYFEAGVIVVWVVESKKRSITVYRSPTDMREFTANEDLPGDEVLPGFSLPVSRIFG